MSWATLVYASAALLSQDARLFQIRDRVRMAPEVELPPLQIVQPEAELDDLFQHGVFLGGQAHLAVTLHQLADGGVLFFQLGELLVQTIVFLAAFLEVGHDVVFDFRKIIFQPLAQVHIVVAHIQSPHVQFFLSYPPDGAISNVRLKNRNIEMLRCPLVFRRLSVVYGYRLL